MPNLTERTTLSLNLMAAIAVAGSIIYGTFVAANWKTSIEAKGDELKSTIWSLQGQLKAQQDNGWSLRDMNDYTRDFRNLNMDLVRADNAPRGLAVPDPRQIHRDNITN